MIINREHLVLSGVYYIHKMDHRNGSPDKSQWIIPEASERVCFQSAYVSWRCDDCNCWGLHFVEGTVVYLGVTKGATPEKRSLFIAKFLDSNKDNKWHGYPADPVFNQQDIPPASILAVWLDSKFLRPAVIRKLSSELTPMKFILIRKNGISVSAIPVSDGCC